MHAAMPMDESRLLGVAEKLAARRVEYQEIGGSL